MEQENTKFSVEQSPTKMIAADRTSPQSAMTKTSSILVLTRNGHMTEPVMEYAVNVADRLKYRIIAAHINTLPFYRDGGRRSRLFTTAMQESALAFRTKADARGVQVKHLGEAGKIGNVVKRLCYSQKHIEFVIIDQGIRKEEVISQSPVPVFNVLYTEKKAGPQDKPNYFNPERKGAPAMSTTSRKRHVKNCFTFGALTAGVYAAIFTNQELVMTYFTKGGLYALLPVAVVFAVSYAHGNFTSSFWSALGIEGSKSTATKHVDSRKDATRRPEVQKDLRPRLQVNV